MKKLKTFKDYSDLDKQDEEKARKEDLDGMCESIAEDYLEDLYDRGAISSDVYHITRDEEDLSSLKGSDKQIKMKVLSLLNDSGGISTDVYGEEIEQLSGNY